MTNLVVDLWQTFDFATLNQANLEANDNCADGTWSVTDANARLSMSASAEKLSPGTFNGTLNDAGGTHGIAYQSPADGQGGFVTYTYASTRAELSFGFWLKIPAGFVGSFSGGNPDVARIRNASDFLTDLYVKLSDNNQAKVHAFTVAEGSSAGVNVSPDVWYWITGLYSSSSLHRVRVYTADGSLVGTEQTRTGSAVATSAFDFVNLVGQGGTFDQPFYHDDLMMNWTTAAFPLGPPLPSIAAIEAGYRRRRV